MTAYNLRSLLVAAIVLSNCITWTASRRHHTHTQQMHRTRHRRQGQGLFLSGSYVIPGGEGTGWGEWRDDSPCSRSCGGGVASQKRICLQIGPDGQPQCTGGDTKYFSCQTQDCPPDAIDFRAEQCAAFDDKDFRGFKYEWIPYTKSPNPCELNCMPRGERFYYKHASKVIDGTRCNDDSFDVCVNGVCQPVGCDMMLGSNAREDKCRQCRGNGVNCFTHSELIDRQDLINGYNDLLLIPAGATSIVIEEIAPSNNYLALRNSNNTFYLNGQYRIDFARTMMIAGAPWTYDRSQSGFAAPDKLRCQGPTNENLILSLLLLDKNVGIQYEYSLPTRLAPKTDIRYNWVTEEFTNCSAVCGGGIQTRNVTCRSSEELDVVEDKLCDENVKPATNQTCNTDVCPPEWVEEPWGECSARCGSEGVRKREVTCQQIIANGYPSLVADAECFKIHGKKPELFQECNRDAVCPQWFIGRWKACDKLCGEGVQTREVTCYQKTNGRIQILDDQECEEEKPATEKPCMLAVCEGTDWIATEWIGCDTCLSKVKTRHLVCASELFAVYDDKFCEYHKRPVTEEACDESKLPPCEAQWYATQWSNCSVECGEGVQTRRVFCGVYESGSVREVEDSKCADLPKYNDTKPCSVPIEECPSQWYTGPWNKCDAECDGGERLRRVMCLRGNKPSTDCPVETSPETAERCNLHPCNSDMVMPVSTTITDEDESLPYCEDEDGEYEEVGLDGETMSSDAGYEPEATLSTLESGSGSGDYTTDDDFTTEDTIFTDDDNSTDITTVSTDITETTESSSDVTGTLAESKTTRGDISSTTISDTETTETDNASTSTDTLNASTEASATDSTSDGTDSSNTISTSSEEATTPSGSTATDDTSATKETDLTETTMTDVTSSTDNVTDDGSTTATKETDATATTITDVTSSVDNATDTDSTGETATDLTSESVTSSDDASTHTTEESGTATTSSDVSSSEVTLESETATTSSDLSSSSAASESTGSESSTIPTGESETATTSFDLSSATSESSSTPSDLSSTTSAESETTPTDLSSTTSADTTETDSSASTTESSESTVSSTPGSGSESTTAAETSTDKTTRYLPTSTEISASTTDSSASTTESAESTTESKTDATVETSATTESSSDSSVASVETTTSGGESTTGEQSTSVAGETTTRAGATETTRDLSSTTEASTTAGSEGTTGFESTIASEGTTESGGTAASEGTTGSESTESGSTDLETTTELVSSTTSESGSTTTSGESSATTESGTSATEASTTEIVSSTESGASSEASESTVSGAASTTTESASISTDSGFTTTESGESSTTEESAATATTAEAQSTTEAATTEGTTLGAGTSPRFTFQTKAPVCRPRKKKTKKAKCEDTQFGCCPDKKRPADGPFNKGCPTIHTCKESEFNCCPDGVSPALGPNNEGCPVTPCEETLFGCCLSDNKTAAQGNDQDGCPPPPPACRATPYGCCADNETEAAGPKAAGCPESETTSTTEQTTAETSTTPFGSTAEESTTVTSIISTESSTTVEGGSTVESIATTDEGSTVTVEGSTPVIESRFSEGCAKSEFGCCYDNETASPGPDGQGCPCNATEFGCCPDGESPAQGENEEGCQGPCKDSAYGCCQDNKTPAHGPEFEGCCLLTSFGCCPDNRKPAEGPHLEGCKCENSEFGCCPDNVTTAAGPNNEGCGCQYTPHGCCPDRHTPALGPDFEGCSCHTYQFGCCPDGVSIPVGPDQQGCQCQYSKYGCCGDEKTAATGPDGTGCDCSSSKYGCCPDGETPAEGPRFRGCSNIPENRQGVCGFKQDTGPCRDYRAMWFYDVEFGGCSQFWYGGCEGNGNKFETKDECEDVCVHPDPKDACNLPSMKGPCDGEYEHWYYNSTDGQCLPFIYGGCLGNDNKFDSQQLCQKQCQPDQVTDTCQLPIEAGPCAGNFSGWGFNAESKKCEQFIYGGCEGNSNRFKTEAACQMRCNPTAKPEKCTLPPAPGDCSPYRLKWFYDTAIKRCRQFYYGGCGGNENNFETEAQCESECHERVVITTTTVRPTARPTSAPAAPAPRQPEPEPEAFCLNEIDQGEPCQANTETRYAYDSRLGKCVTFQYQGCGGNQNNFPDIEYCIYYCHPVQDVCQLPMLTGSCDDSVMSWFYDATSDSCSQFTYSGCDGNENRFESREACETRCRTGVVASNQRTTHAPATPAISTVDKCAVSPTLEECTSSGEVWFFDSDRNECVPHMNPGSGAECRHAGTFESQEACERGCGNFRGIDVCTQRKDPGPCREFVAKVYFDQESGTCKTFGYGGCLGGANRFSTVQECQQVCQSHLDACTQPLEPGECNKYVLQWYFDATHGCTQFVYTGCGGNDNRFDSKEDCKKRCSSRPSPSLTTTTVAPVPEPEPESECVTPRSIAPCGSNRTVFYYDSNTKSCVAGEFGNCRHPNSYPSEEACERRCGAFRGLDVCHARLDIGPCHDRVRKYYFDVATGSCQAFTYGGCAGGPNRFSTVEECKDICGDSGPAPRCLLEVDTGSVAGCRAVSVPRYHYSPADANCIVFVYTGCGGNANNFPTYQQCQQTCLRRGTLDDNEVGCDAYERHCASLKCPYGVVRAPAQGGCESCACVDVTAHCSQLRQECDALVCPFGINRVQDGECERCECYEDPCSYASCASNQRCTATPYTDPVTNEERYAAICTNAGPDCSQQRANCDRLRCQHGVDRTVDAQGCDVCKCIEDPCQITQCPAGERCVLSLYRDIMGEEQKSAECRPTTKPGYCPVDQTISNEVGGRSDCQPECNDDADCRGVGKCCSRGCGRMCTVPLANLPPVTTTYKPELPAAPQALPQPEPQLTATEGGKAVLRCLFQANPPPRITWRFGELTIDGDVGRYRLTSEGALEIISLYRNDTGVYICVADNELGSATQEIHLVVNDPVRMAAGIAGEENAVVTGEFNQPLSISCLAYGYPPPGIYWEHHGAMVAFNDDVYESRGNTLLIKSLQIETLGQYVCQAYNGIDKAASWVVTVRAYQPEGLYVQHEYVVPRQPPRQPVTTRAPTPSTRQVTTTTTSTTTTTNRPVLTFTVPVSTHVSTPYSSLKAGQELRIICEVDGYPDPNVYWSKDSTRISPDDRISISGSAAVSRLVISKVAVSDSGLYSCHAENDYSSSTDNTEISVQQSVLPAKCTDNPFFANCDLIVRSKFCNHKYYSKFCCKSCVEAGQLDPRVAEMQADQPYRRKK